MGEVWRAHDTRLDRSVAIKVLPREFAADEKVKMRFEREAKTISQLSHPNICTLYDVGHEGGVEYLVMELIEGESLAERIARAPLPMDEVIRFGVEIARALHRAHLAGVIHRDVKPGNIMLARDGAKLLDFGLARSAVVQVAPDGATLQKPLTQEGAIVGTFQYMAPEQLEGQNLDHRTDIFALGAVLYEMATGRRAFEGKTKTSLIAAIVSARPTPVSQLQPLVPPELEHVIERCMEKAPADRWQSAHDVAEELKWVGSRGAATGATAPIASRRTSREVLAWSLALVVAIAAATTVTWQASRARASQRVVTTSIVVPEKATFVFDVGTAILSPDGTRLAFAADEGGVTRIWVRQLDSTKAQPLAGTEGASFPFWSFDGKAIGFFADGSLKRIDVSGGPVETLAKTSSPRGGAWGRDGTILFTPSTYDALYAVSASGGEVRQATKLDPRGGVISHRFPSFAPDGRHFVFLGFGASGIPNVLLGTLDGPETVPLTIADAGAQFAPSGHLLFVRDRILRAQRVDLRAKRLVGEATPLAEAVQVSNGINFANFSTANNGVLSYVGGPSATVARLVWFDATGKKLAETGAPGEYFDPRISHDGKVVSYIAADNQGNLDLWTIDLERGVPTRFTFTNGNEYLGAWSPDDRLIAYTSVDRSPGDIYVARSDHSGEPELLAADPRRKIVNDWSRDGRYLLFHTFSPGTRADIDAWSFGERKIIPILHSPFSEIHPHLSPDGVWMAYVSDESGRNEVYVQKFLVPSAKWQVSSRGGSMPRWSRDGRQIFYYSADGKLMAASVRPGATFSVDAPRILFAVRMRTHASVTRNQYDVSPDGRFLINVVPLDQASPPITLVQNWPLLLRDKQ